MPQLGQAKDPAAGAPAPVLLETAADPIKGSKTADDTDGKTDHATKKDGPDTTAQAPANPAANAAAIVPLAAPAACPVAAPAPATPPDNVTATGVQGHGATSVTPAGTAGAQSPGPGTQVPGTAGAQSPGPGTQVPGTAAQTSGPDTGAADAAEPPPQAVVQAGSLLRSGPASSLKGKSDAAASRTGTPAENPPPGASDSESAGIQPPATTGPENNNTPLASTAKPGPTTSARGQAPQSHHTASQASAGLTGQTGNPGDATAASPFGNGTATSAFTVASNGHTAATSSTSPAAADAGTAATAGQAAPVPIAGIAVAIAGRALAGNNHFDIRLDPPELGRIEVRLKVDRDGQVTSHLIADRHDTLDLLRRDMPGLERALQDAGLKTAGDGLQFSLRDQSGGGQDGSRPRTPNLIVPDDAAPTLDVSARSYGRFAGRIGGLDIRV